MFTTLTNRHSLIIYENTVKIYFVMAKASIIM